MCAKRKHLLLRFVLLLVFPLLFFFYWFAGRLWYQLRKRRYLSPAGCRRHHLGHYFE